MIESDKELLILAAKAAGIGLWKDSSPWRDTASGVGLLLASGAHLWNPLTDDADAFRLAIKMHFEIRFYWDGCNDQYDEVEVHTNGAKKDAREQIGYFGGNQIDENDATRRAITRAAAEIGKAMPCTTSL